MEPQPDLAAAWDDAYPLGDDTHGWFQTQPKLSLQMLDAAGSPPPTA
jgi:hypothetical protein